MGQLKSICARVGAAGALEKGVNRSEGNNDADGEPELGPQQCEARCRRLRFSHRMQLQCIHCCHNLEDEECNPNGEGEAFYAMTY